MKRILVVDDEPSILFGLSEGLADERRRIEVITAPGGQEAIAILDARKIDLVLTDLRMPEVDGFELLTYLRRNHPHLPVILMTAHGPDELSRLGAPGELEWFSKPVDLPSIRRRITEMLAQRVRGKVENISLASFLQLLEMERKTCTLGVVAGDHRGRLFFRGGRLIAAEADELTGHGAALEIVTWDQADIEISDLLPGVEPALDVGLQFLLMEGMRLKDERERGVGGIGGVGGVGGVAGMAGLSGLPPGSLGDIRDEDAALDSLLPAPDLEGLEALGPLDEVAGKIREGLDRAREIEGSLGILLVEVGRGRVIGAAVGAAGVSETDLEAAAISMAQLLRARQLLSGEGDRFDEVVLSSLERQYLVRMLGTGKFFLLLVLDRPKANLGMSRLQLAGVERNLAERLPDLVGPGAEPEAGKGGRRKETRRK